MPELPEVETVRNTLKKHVLNNIIKECIITYDKIIENIETDEFAEKVVNQKINDIKRLGKWLLFELDDYYLLSHLRMEGKYFIRENDYDDLNHVHVVFVLDNKKLLYQDTRKFGKMHLIKKEDLFKEKPIKDLGYEPWDSELTSKYLKEKYKKKNIPIKTVLLDQSIITGIGNIYADEILFLCQISPLRKASELTKKDLNNIISFTRKVLEKAIKEGGTTIRTYSSDGVHGRFQQSLYVHNKLGRKCLLCSSPIEKTRVGGRGTYYCPKCQKR
ncbi:MAG: DNA-formamidopyrimidine glycosylase [Mycoplasmatota bacterium]